MDGAKVSFLHVSQNVPTDSPMEVTYIVYWSLQYLIFELGSTFKYEGDTEQAKGKPDPCIPGSATLKVRSVFVREFS